MAQTVTLIKQFCRWDFVERNCDKAAELLTEDITWFGTSDYEDVHSKAEAYEYLQNEIRAMPEPYALDFLEESFLPLGNEGGIALLRVRFSHSNVVLNIRITGTSRVEKGKEKIASLHFSVSDGSQQEDEFYPVEQHKLRLEQEKESLVLSTMDGGLMGSYYEEGLPFYFINDRMLQFLGYSSEREFVTAINGLIDNVVHPADRERMTQSIHEQIAESGRYVVDERLRKRDGSYIWVHDIGQLSTDPEGRAILVSVCYDVTAERKRQTQLDNIINAIPGGVAIYKFSDILENTYFSDGVPALAGFTVEEYRKLLQGDASQLTYFEDRQLVAEKLAESCTHYTDFNFRTVHKDGHAVWVHAQCTRIGEADGCPLIQCVFYNISNQKEQEMLNQHLLNSMAGGVILYELLAVDTLHIVKYSKGIPALSGYTEKEYSAIADNGFDIVYKPELPRLHHAIEQMLQTETSVQTSHHICHKDGYLVGVHMNACIIGNRNGHPLVCAVFMKMSDEANIYQIIAQKSKDGIYVISKENHKLLYMNDQAKHAFKIDGKKDITTEHCYELLRGRTTPCDECKVLNSPEGELYELYAKSLNRYLLGTSYTLDWAGTPAFVAYVSDITANKSATQEITNIYNNIPGAVFRCKFDADWTVIFANDGLYRFLGYTREEFAAMGNKMSAVIYPADLKIMTGVIAAQLQEGKTTAENENRLICKDGTIKWISIKAQLLRDNQGEQYFYCVFVDISKQKQDELRRIESERNLSIATSHIDLYYWEILDFQKRSIRVTEYVQKQFGMQEYAEGYPERFLALGFVAPEDCATYTEGVERIYRGEKYSQFDARIKTLTHGYVWMRLRLTRIEEPGKEPRAVGTAEEIAEYKDLEQRVTMVMKQNNISSWRYDIKRQVLVPNMQGFWPTGWGIINQEYKLTDLLRFLHPDDVQPWLNFHSTLKQSAKGDSLCVRLCPDSSKVYRHILCHYTLLPDRDGVPTYALGSCTDITEQVQQKEKYEAAVHNRYKALDKNVVLIGHCNITQDKLIEIEDRTGMQLQQRFGTNGDAFFKGLGTLIKNKSERKAFYASTLSQQLNADFSLGITQHNVIFVAPLATESYENGWFSLCLDTVEQPQTGDLLGFITITDITESKRQEQMLETVVHRNYDYIAHINLLADSMTLYRHRELQEEDPNYHTGQTYSFSAAVSYSAQNFVDAKEQESYLAKASLENLRNKLQQQDKYEFSFHMRENGMLRAKHMRIDMLDRATATAVMTRSDVTDMLEQQEQKKNQLSQALEIAKSANQHKSEFLSSMSHDIRTPMNAIIGMCALALEDEQDAQQVHESLKTIQSSSQILLSLINNILDMSRIESGKTVLHDAPFSLSSLIQETTDNHRILYEQKNQQFRLTTNINHDSCRGDISCIHSAIDNVLSNAIKYTPEGGTIACCVTELPSNNLEIGLYRFEIADTGIGISQEDQKHIFDPFYRGDVEHTYDAQGTGLGLSITKQIVELKGGTISVKSSLGVGTTFVIDLPLQFCAENTMAALDEAESIEKNYDFTGVHILLCEDHPINQKVITRILEKAHVLVTIAQNGREGLEKFAHSELDTYQLIFMDIRMPVMNGYEAATAIRACAHPQAKLIPIIALSANAFIEDMQKSKQHGMNGHIAKPVMPEQIYKIIETYCGQ